MFQVCLFLHKIFRLCYVRLFDMLWRIFTVFTNVPHNISPQYIKYPTTYTHNIWSLVDILLWRTTRICCGEHMLWSTSIFTDEVGFNWLTQSRRGPRRVTPPNILSNLLDFFFKIIKLNQDRIPKKVALWDVDFWVFFRIEK